MPPTNVMPSAPERPARYRAGHTVHARDSYGPITSTKDWAIKWTKSRRARISCCSTRRPPRRVASLAGWWTRSGAQSPTAGWRRAAGCPLPACWPPTSRCPAGWLSRRTVGSPTRGWSAAGAVAARPSWPGPAVRIGRARDAARSRRIPAADPPAATGRRGHRPHARRSRPVRVPARRLAARRARRPGRSATGRARLRRPARAPVAARGARAMAGPHPRVAGQPGRHPRRLRRRPGLRADCPAVAP